MSQNKPLHLKILADLIKSETSVPTLIQEQYPATLEELYGHLPRPIAGDHRAQAAKVMELFRPQDRIRVRQSDTEEEATLIASERNRCTLGNYDHIQLCAITGETTVVQVVERRLFAVQLLLNDASVIRWLCEGLELTLLTIIHGSHFHTLVFKAPSERVVTSLHKFLVGLGIVLGTSEDPEFWLELPQEKHNVRLVYLANMRSSLDVMAFDS